MKKLLVASLALLVVFGFVGLADEDTKVDVDWDATLGRVNVDFQGGGYADASLDTVGGSIEGYFEGSNKGEGGYSNTGYADTIQSVTEANVDGGGFISFGMDRGDSSPSPTGQGTGTLIETTGEAYFATSTTSSWSRLQTYNYHVNNAVQFSASAGEETDPDLEEGSGYYMNHYIHAGDEDSRAEFTAFGDGSVDVTTGGANLPGETSWELGKGTDTSHHKAYASGEGEGFFSVMGQAPNEVSSPWTDLPGGGTVNLNLEYSDGFNLEDFRMSGN